MLDDFFDYITRMSVPFISSIGSLYGFFSPFESRRIRRFQEEHRLYLSEISQAAFERMKSVMGVDREIVLTESPNNQMFVLNKYFWRGAKPTLCLPSVTDRALSETQCLSTIHHFGFKHELAHIKLGHGFITHTVFIIASVALAIILRKFPVRENICFSIFIANLIAKKFHLKEEREADKEALKYCNMEDIRFAKVELTMQKRRIIAMRESNIFNRIFWNEDGSRPFYISIFHPYVKEHISIDERRRSFERAASLLI